MKNILTILFLYIGFLQSLLAQQNHPTPSAIQTDKTFYMYNLNKRGFLVGGNNWNAQASLSNEHAYKIVLKKYIDSNNRWDGVTYYITDSVEKGYFRGKYRTLFISKEKDLYVDQDYIGYNRIRDNLWTIQPIQGKQYIYRISPSPHNKENQLQDKQLGVIERAIHSIYEMDVVGLCNPNGNGKDYEWCFIDSKEKDAFLENEKQQRAVRRLSILNNRQENDTLPTEQVVYMYNTDYDGFLVGGNQYKTLASLSKKHAHKVILHKYINAGEKWNGKTYYITDSVENGWNAGKYQNVFLETNGKVWVDQKADNTLTDNSYLDCLWDIVPSNDDCKTYYITPSCLNQVFTPAVLPDYYLGAQPSVDSWELPVVELLPLEKCSNRKWVFINEKQWQQIHALECKGELQNLINRVKELFPAHDVTQAQTVCNDNNASLPTIYCQIGLMRLLLIQNQQQAENEVSFTQLLKNAGYEVRDGNDWRASYNVETGSINWYGGDDLNHCAEAYQTIFSFSQEVKGIPNGLYRVDVQAFSRTRQNDLAWLERDSSFVVPVIFANQTAVPVMNLMLHTFPSNEGEYDFLQTKSKKSYSPAHLTMGGTFSPNNITTTALAFAKGYFDQSLYCIVDSGKINIGITENHKRIGAWTAWDNFRLTYLNENTKNYAAAINYHLLKAKEMAELARIKGVDNHLLTDAIEQAELSLKNNDDPKQLREQLLSLNQNFTLTRKQLEQQEFRTEQKIITYSNYVQNEVSNEHNELYNQRYERARKIMHRWGIADSYYHVGKTILDSNYQLSIELFKKAINLYFSPLDSAKNDYIYAINENFHDCVAYLDMCYEQKEQYEKSIDVVNAEIKYLLNASADNKNNYLIDNYSRLGFIYAYRIKDFSTAEAMYRKGTIIAKDIYQESKERFGKANSTNSIQDWSRIVHQYTTCLNELAYTQAYQYHFDEALATISKAIEVNPNETNLYDSKGEFWYMKGDKQRAKKMWKKVKNLSPSFYVKQKNSQLNKWFQEK